MSLNYRIAWSFFIPILLRLSATCTFSQYFTLEDVLSTPYPTNLIAASKADRIAWVLNDQGDRNLWTAAAPGFKPVQLTTYTEDNGEALSHLVLTPDGSTLVYVKGGPANEAGEHPNPTSNPKGTEQALWAISTDGGAPWKLALGSNPVISPTGQQLLFIRQDQIYQVPLDPLLPDSVRKAEQLFKARGNNGRPVWSPDGQKILFVSDRGDHSFIGIFERENNKIRWIAPSVDRDGAPVWSPDGRQIAFIRVPGARKGELWDLTSGWPFAIWVADLAKDKVREIWKSPADDGLYAQVFTRHPLRWTKNDRLLFYSEHEGWLHIYSITPEGDNLVDLTPGFFEVENSTLSPDGTMLYYSSNHQDIDRRHIWCVPTKGGRSTQLTQGQTIETDMVVLASRSGIAYRSASARRPTTITLQHSHNNKPQILSPELLPKRFPTANLVEPRQVTFTASDGLRIHGQLFMPQDAKAGDKRPAVIFLHGGPIRQMLLGWHYLDYYAKAYAMNQYLANQGYVVFSVNFRCGIGYGRDFRRADEQGPRGASEYGDIIAAGRHLRTLPEVDPQKIGLWGGSYGGYLTALGLARDSDLFAAGVDLHGVHDWAFRATDFFPGGAWGLQGDSLLKVAYQSSPVSDLSYWSSPVLLVHGDDDRNVMFAQTTDLVQRLREHNVHVETLVFPDEVHGFLRHESWLRTFQAAADFFDRFLK